MAKDRIARWVFEAEQVAHTRDGQPFHQNPPTGLDDPGAGAVDVVHGERAFRPGRVGVVEQATPLLQGYEPSPTPRPRTPLPTETHLTLAAWHRRARILAAVDLITAGSTVTLAATNSVTPPQLV